MVTCDTFSTDFSTFPIGLILSNQPKVAHGFRFWMLMGLSILWDCDKRTKHFFIELYKFFHTKHVFKSESYIRLCIESGL